MNTDHECLPIFTYSFDFCDVHLRIRNGVLAAAGNRIVFFILTPDSIILCGNRSGR